MHSSTHGLTVPQDQALGYPQQRTGCGCCQHCSCTGHCISELEVLRQNLNASPHSPLKSPRAKSPSSEGSHHRSRGEDDFFRVLKSAPHPGDAVALPRKFSNKLKVDREDASSDTSSRRPSDDISKPEIGNKKSDKVQEEYEAAYCRRARETLERSRSEIKIREHPPSDDEECATVSTKRSHHSDASEHQREKRKDRVVAEWPHNDEKGHEYIKTSSKMAFKGDILGKENVEKDINVAGKEGEVRRRSSHRRREEDAAARGSKEEDRGSKSSNEKHIGDLPSSPSKPSRRDDVHPSDSSEDHLMAPRQQTSKVRSKREIMREIKHLVKEAAMAPSSTSTKTIGALCSTTAALTDIQKAIDTIEEISDNRSSSLKVVKRLSVHLSSEYASTLLFNDDSRRTDDGHPLVAFRLQDSDCSLAKKGGAGFVFRKPDQDWLHDSYENGAKMKSKVSLAVGVRGPSVYEISVRHRKVDRYAISSREDAFSTKPNGGSHDDHRHLYFETPDGTAMKWELVEDDRLMRLYGRGEKDYGIIYAEAKMHHRKHKSKEAVLFFYDPSDAAQPKSKGHIDVDLDYAFLCSTWWCARQTFDESRLVAAHDEVHFIENIEDAFEIDLLALA